jgi:hypothetical protein
MKVYNTSGQLLATATAPPYNKTLVLMAGSSMIPVTKPATLDQAELAAGAPNYIYGEYAAGGDEYLQWITEMPAGWDGVNLTLIIDWLTTSATTNYVKWELYAKRFTNAVTLNTALASVTTVEDQNNGASYLNSTTETAAFTVTGTGNFVVFALTRIAPTGTTLAAAARVINMQIKYSTTVTY